MNSNIIFCECCNMRFISEEIHDCPLKDIKYVGHTLIQKRWYITSTSEDGFNWKTIKPIPLSDESIQGDKDDTNRRRVDRTQGSHLLSEK